jgi:hypothetical protein
MAPHCVGTIRPTRRSTPISNPKRGNALPASGMPPDDGRTAPAHIVRLACNQIGEEPEIKLKTTATASGVRAACSANISWMHFRGSPVFRGSSAAVAKGPPPGARSRRRERPPGRERRSPRERWCAARRAGVRPRPGRAPAPPGRARPGAAGRPPGCTPSTPGTSGQRTRAAPGRGRAARSPPARGGRWAPPGSGPAGGPRAARAWPGRARQGPAASSPPVGDRIEGAAHPRQG